MVTADQVIELSERGIVLLRDIFATDSLRRLKAAAERCFAAISQANSIPDRYHFNQFSNSLHLTALADFSCSGQDLLAPLSTPGLDTLFSASLGHAWTCSMEHSWLRKKFAPSQAPTRAYHPQDWHQDGALGVRFPEQPFLAESGPGLLMTELLTCWIPLNACGTDSPGLEFIHRPQPSLLHFNELNDSALRQRFSSQLFWAPKLEFGDGLVFLNSVLHRTHTHAQMTRNRLSIEYRIFATLPTPVSGASSGHSFA